MNETISIAGQTAVRDARDAHTRPALATTYEGGDPLLLQRIAPLVEYLEISPDSISLDTGGRPTLNPEIVAELSALGDRAQFLVHGVGLSIASADGFSQDYVRLLDEIFTRFPVAWHSEHLAYTTVDGEPLGTMLPPPRTEEALAMLCGRVAFMQGRYSVPFLLEHIVRFLPEYPGEYSEAGFLNELARRTGCGLILDAYNLECDRENLGFDVESFLDELDLSRVKEIHVAGGVYFQGYRVDVHSQRSQNSTIALARSVLERAPDVRAVTFEFLKEAMPRLGHDAICLELQHLREVLLYERAG